MNNMVYTTLVIKDARRVNQCWKWSVVSILFGIVLTGLTVTFSFHALLDNFNGNCVSGVSLVFVHRDEVANATGETPVEDSIRFSYYRRLQQQQMGARSQNFTDRLRQHFSEASSNDVTEENAVKLRRRRLNEEDMEFFETQKIDELNSYWGSKTPCDYFSFVPLLESIVAIVWLTLFIMCGNGGRSTETFVDEPWRIVPPSFAFFVLMVIVSTVYLCLLVSRLEVFCIELTRSFHDQTVPCPLLIDQFSLNDSYIVQPSHNYLLTLTFAWMTLGLWTLSVMVMSARCYLGIDFETLYTPPPYPNGIYSEADVVRKGNGGVACSVNENRKIINVDDDGGEDDEMDDLTEDAVAVVMHLNGKELKLCADRANMFVAATIDEEPESSVYSGSNSQKQKGIRLVNEVGRPRVPKATRIKSYNHSSA